MISEEKIDKALSEYTNYKNIGIDIDKRIFRSRLNEEEYKEFKELAEYIDVLKEIF